MRDWWGEVLHNLSLDFGKFRVYNFKVQESLNFLSVRIVEMLVRADPFDYSGTCPVLITFRGRISVAGGGGTVSYKWIRNDGASAPVQTLTFDSPGSQDVTDTWNLGDAGMNYSGWEALQVFDPKVMTSDHADFKIQCQ